ncbi:MULTISPECIES: hypothetical protein [Burkholderiaceae]|uniref:hypothetical protein n=1 Tax=Burkholderiaceae TaxID=119060 RepID=UPI000976BA8C|nr:MULTISPECIES: hypothetical protein [Burkholderiaceae]MCG1039241.1 hypothetical protein [Mycetohabitans sp. B7]
MDRASSSPSRRGFIRMLASYGAPAAAGALATAAGRTLGAAPQHGGVLCCTTGTSGYGTQWSSTALTPGMFCAATRIALISSSRPC